MDDFDWESNFWDETRVMNKKKKKRLRPGVKVFVLVLAFFAGFVFLGYKVSDWWLGEGLSSAGQQPPADTPAAVEQPSKLILLLDGIDRRGDEPSRADTIMVAFINTDDGDVDLLSIPRDTYVQIPDHGWTKINAAHAYGGPELLAETVSGFLDVPVSKYVELDFEGFSDIINVLGGVELDVDKRMYNPDEGIDLQPGEQELNGDEALAYVRYRDEEGDIGRIPRQQKFVTALADQAVSLGTVVKLPVLLSKINGCTNTNLSFREMLSLAKVCAGLKTADITTATVPGDPEYVDGISYWKPYDEETSTIVKDFLARNDA